LPLSFRESFEVGVGMSRLELKLNEF